MRCRESNHFWKLSELVRELRLGELNLLRRARFGSREAVVKARAENSRSASIKNSATIKKISARECIEVQ